MDSTSDFTTVQLSTPVSRKKLDKVTPNGKAADHKVKGYVYLAALVAAIGGLIFGYDIGGSGGTFVMDSFRNQMGWPSVGDDTPTVVYQQALITSIFSIGCMIGSVPSGMLADRYGRKFSLQIAGMIFTFGALLQITCFEIVQLLIGRLVGGIGVGMMSMLVTVYQSEIAPKHLRGVLVTLQQLCITLGIFLAALFNVPLSTTTVGWRFSYGLNGFYAVVMVLFLIPLPESPRWLMQQRAVEAARAALSQVRQASQVEPELAEVGQEISDDEALGEGTWMELCTTIPNQTMVGFMIQFLQQFTGINVIMYFAPVIFNTFLSPAYSLWANVGIQGAMFVSTFLAVGLIDRAGRKKLLLVGGTLQAVFCMSIAVMASSFFDYKTDQALGMTIVACIGMYVVNFAYGWGPVPWVVCAEIFPLRLRGKGMTVSTLTNWLTNFIIGLITPFMLQPSALNISGTFVFFGCFCVAMTIWVAIQLPETANVSLEDMPNVFKAYSVRRAVQK